MKPELKHSKQSEDKLLTASPDTEVDVTWLFGLDTAMRVPAFSESNAYVPELDPGYLFDRKTTIELHQYGNICLHEWRQGEQEPVILHLSLETRL